MELCLPRSPRRDLIKLMEKKTRVEMLFKYYLNL